MTAVRPSALRRIVPHWWLHATFAALLAVCSCASPPDAQPDAVANSEGGGAAHARPERAADEPSGASDPTAAWSELAASIPTRDVWIPSDDGSTDGVVVLRWQVPDNADAVNSFFDAHKPPMLTDSVQDRLLGNGMRVASVPIAELAASLDRLGGTASSIRLWLGQAHAWTQVTALPLRGQCAALVDGSTRRLSGGTLQFLVRGWTVPLEKGAVTDVELQPAFLAGGAVPGARASARESFPGAGFSVALERGTAMLVTSAPARASSVGQGPASGPPVQPPATLGELLLGRQGGDRDVLRLRPIVVIAPLIANRHFAEASAVDFGGTGAPP